MNVSRLIKNINLKYVHQFNKTFIQITREWLNYLVKTWYLTNKMKFILP